MAELTVVTFLYGGWRSGKYRPEHVYALQAMLQRYLTIPHRFVCITDQPGNLDCDTYPMWPFPSIDVRRGRPNNYQCLRLFDKAEDVAGAPGRMLLVLDLDVLIRDNIDHLVTDDDFKAVRGLHSPYNSSVWLLRAGAHKGVWDCFDPEGSPRLLEEHTDPDGRRWIGSDQAWMSYMIPDAPTWDRGDGVYHYLRHCRRGPPKGASLVYFAGNVYPWNAGRNGRWAEEEYHAITR